MKTCAICRKEKQLVEFNKNKTKKDGLQNFCRNCQHIKFRQYYSDNKKHHRSVVMSNTKKRVARVRSFVVEYLKEHPCVDCGTSDIRVLEFDHLPEFAKANEVSRMIHSGCGWETVKSEIDKCEIRCRNCHAIKTYERMGGSWHDKFLTGL